MKASLWIPSLLLVTAFGCDKFEPVGYSVTPSQPSDEATPDAPDEQASVVAVGAKAPDFEVETLGGEMLRLSSLFGKARPTILLFDRAHW